MSEQRLNDVDVALDEARKYRCIAGVEDVGCIAVIASVFGHGRDAAVADRDVTPK